MTKAPERIERIVKFLCGAEPNESGECFSEAAERERGKFWWRKWVRQLEREAHDHALALVAAEREAVARWHDEAAQHDQRGLDYSDAVGIPISNAVELSESVKFHRQSAASIRARTNNDAQAALERVKQEAWRSGMNDAADASDSAGDFRTADAIRALITEGQSDE